MKTLLILILSLSLSLNICAQAPMNADTSRPDPIAGDMQLQYKYYGDSVVLRWGFDHPQLWYAQIDKPVTVWRRDVTNKGEYEKIAEVTPWDSTAIETAASKATHPDMLVVVLENMYRHWNNTLFTDYSSILERNDNFFNRWSLVHLAAEQDISAAYAAGLRFADKKIKPGISYAYKVTAAVNGSSDYKVAFATVRNFVPVLFDIEEGDSVVTLHWERKLHDYHFSSYWIEQSVDGKNFTRINSAPYVQMLGEEITAAQRFYSYPIMVTNYQSRYYRIVGNDAFADESNPSDAVKAMGRDRTPPAAPFLIADTTQMHLQKHFTWTHPNPSDVKLYWLERSFNNETVFKQAFASGTGSSGKDTVSVEGIYKYRLVAIDTAGNPAYSEAVYTKVYDLVPPAQPVQPLAIADTSGFIQLAWEVHPEADVIGYNIYAADGKQRNFTKLNQHIYRTHVYTDSISLNLLNEKRYYQIVAVDNDYMLSEPSPVLAVDRPDVIPPAPALIGDYKVLPEGIRITILPSSSRDVVRHELQRSATDQSMKTIATFNTIPHSFVDTTVNAETTYTYRVIAYDEAGLMSHSVKDLVITSMHQSKAALEISYTVDGDTIRIAFSWQDTDANTYQLYRAVDDQAYQQHATVSSPSYQEKLRTGSVYHYRVRALQADGRMAPLSNEITVQLPTQ